MGANLVEEALEPTEKDGLLLVYDKTLVICRSCTKTELEKKKNYGYKREEDN